jgi:hypothetical protein
MVTEAIPFDDAFLHDDTIGARRSSHGCPAAALCI